MTAWIEEYTCGCSVKTQYKRDLPGYCATHGGDRQGVYKLTPGKPIHWEREGPKP